jgi:L,D-transpeptidase catalytic domain/Putative peptidoglycan binding domain
LAFPVRKVLIAVLVLFVFTAGGAAVAAWRYDESRQDRLAEGIVIAGVDVGGMRVADARAALERQVASRLEQPMAVRYRHGQFVFEPTKADVGTNLDALLAGALAESRDGNFLTRAFRDLTGGHLNRQLALDVTYSSRAVGRFVRWVGRQVDRNATEAKSSASFAGVRISPSEDGVAIKAESLAARLGATLVDPEAARSFRLPTRVVHAKVTTAELEKRFHYFLAVSRSQFELRLFVDQRLAKTYDVAIGQIGYKTPAGLYEIRTKAVNPAWYVPNKPWAGDLAGKVIPPNDPGNPIKARWMGFWDGAGIHGTAEADSIGSAASHGCIRMRVPDVIELYDRVPLHTPLYVS